MIPRPVELDVARGDTSPQPTGEEQVNIQDWSQIVSFDANIHSPTSHDELKEALLDASGRRNGAIRVLGGLHSCSNIFASDTIINVEGMPTTIDYTEDGTAAVVSLNWHLGDLLEELSKRDKSLNATGGEDSQTLAGLISTDTAPATPRYGIYELVDWVEYITLDDEGGGVVEKRVSKEDPEFRAVICSLGAIGILTRARFRVRDQPYFETVQKIVPMKDVLGDLEATSRTYDFWRINWLQNTDQGLLWAATEIPKDQADPNGDYEPDGSERTLRNAFMFLAKVGNGGPLLNGFAKRSVFWVVRKLYKAKRNTGPLRHMLPVDRYTPLHVAMAEWFFRPDDREAVLAACREYFKKAHWPNLPIEIELAKTDDYHMSPMNWPGLSYVLKCNFQYMTDCCSEKEKAQIYDHLRGLWRHLIGQDLYFKAHWGKINFMDHDYVRSHCELADFQRFIRPAFLNGYLTERLTKH